MSSSVTFHFSNGTSVMIELSESFLLSLGSTWFLDSFWLFINMPIAIIGCIFNTLSSYILSQILNKNQFVYKLLIFYCINSSLILIAGVATTFNYSIRYIGLRVDFLANIIQCVFTNYLITTHIFICNILDIVLSMQRFFLLKLRNLNRINPNWILLATILLANIINIPTILRYYVENESEEYSNFEISIKNEQIPFLPWVIGFYTIMFL